MTLSGTLYVFVIGGCIKTKGPPFLLFLFPADKHGNEEGSFHNWEKNWGIPVHPLLPPTSLEILGELCLLQALLLATLVGSLLPGSLKLTQVPGRALPLHLESQKFSKG